MALDLEKMLVDTFGFIRGESTNRKTYLRIPADRVLEDEFAGTALVPGETYFQITLSEMFIRYQREYWMKFLPFVLMVVEFSFAEGKKSVPVFTGPELLKSIEDLVKGESVEYRNTTVLGPTPYSDGGIKLFLGLFRSKSEDLAGRMVDMVGTIGEIFPIAELSHYVKLLEPLEKGIAHVLGMKDVELGIGLRDEFQDKTAPNPVSPAVTHFEK